MARFRHISTKLVLVLDAGSVNGKKATKRVTVSGIREDASADALWKLAEALGHVLAYPVAEVRLYTVEELEMEDADGETDANGGVHKEAGAGMPRAAHSLQAARLGRGAPLLPGYARLDGTDSASALNKRAGAFSGAAARMNSPPLSRGLLAAFRVTPAMSARKKAKERGADFSSLPPIRAAAPRHATASLWRGCCHMPR